MTDPDAVGQSAAGTALEEAVGMLGRIWREDLLVARVGRVTWLSLRDALDGYPQTAVQLVWGWHRDSILAACRRLLDTHPRAFSLARALTLLGDNARDVTGDWLARRWVDLDPTGEPDRAARHARHALDARATPDGHLDRAHVDADLDRLHELGRAAKRYATRRVAHRDPRSVDTVTFEDVDRLLTEAARIHGRWYALLFNATVDDRVDHLDQTRPIVIALRLFDWDDYIESFGKAEHRWWQRDRGSDRAVPSPYDEPVEVCYRFPRLEDDLPDREPG